MISRVEVKKLIDEDIIDERPDVNLVNQTLLNLVNTGLLNKEDKERYVFKEQVTWEVVYETLLYSERRYLHDIVASHIEENKANEIESYAARLVYHYQKSENKKKIIFYSALAGDYAYSLFAIDDALDFYRNALSQLETINNYPKIDKCLLLEKKADVVESSGIYRDAISLYEDALNTLSDEVTTRRTFLPWHLSALKRKSILMHKISVVCQRNLMFEKSLEWLDLSEQNLPKQPGSLRAKISSSRSVAYFRKYEFDKAMSYAKASLRQAKKINDKSHVYYANNAIANIFSALGNNVDAIKYYEGALDICLSNNNYPGMSICYFNMGVALAFVPDLDSSNECFKKSIELNKKMKNNPSLFEDYYMLGDNFLTVKDLESALFYFEKSINIFNDGMSCHDTYSFCLSKIAEVYLHMDKIDKAEHYIKESLRIVSGMDERLDAVAQVKNVQVDIYIKKNMFDEAEELLKLLYVEFTELNFPDFIIMVLKKHARVKIKRNDIPVAIEKLNEAKSIAEQIESDYENMSVELLTLYAKFLHGVYDSNLNEKLETIKGKVHKYRVWHDRELYEEFQQKIGY